MMTVMLVWLVFLMGAVVGLGVGFALGEHNASGYEYWPEEDDRDA